MAKQSKDGRPVDPRIIKALNEVITAELTAINQYFLHAKMCKDWGFLKLAGKIRAESIDEMKHADTLIERVLYLGGIPNVQKLGKINSDLALEHEALPRLNTAIALCVETGDNGTRAMLEEILRSEEEHTDWLETQLKLIDQIGLQNYLTQQIGG